MQGKITYFNLPIIYYLIVFNIFNLKNKGNQCNDNRSLI